MRLRHTDQIPIRNMKHTSDGAEYTRLVTVASYILLKDIDRSGIFQQNCNTSTLASPQVGSSQRHIYIGLCWIIHLCRRVFLYTCTCIFVSMIYVFCVYDFCLYLYVLAAVCDISYHFCGRTNIKYLCVSLYLIRYLRTILASTMDLELLVENWNDTSGNSPQEILISHPLVIIYVILLVPVSLFGSLGNGLILLSIVMVKVSRLLEKYN